MTGFFKDLAAGDFSAVWDDITSAFNKMPSWVKAFLARAETDGGQLLSTLAQDAFKDVVAGGFTTASFVAAAKDIVAKALAQGQTILINDAFTQLNMLAGQANATATTDSAPVTAATDTTTTTEPATAG